MADSINAATNLEVNMKRLLLPGTLLIIATSSATAQVQPPRGLLAIQHQIQVNGRTETGVPMRVTRTMPQLTFMVDSIEELPRARRVYTRAITVDAGIDGVAIAAVPAAPYVSPAMMQRDSTMPRRMEQRRLVLDGGAGTLFPEQVLAAAFRNITRPLRVGASWTEPVAWELERLGMRSSERGRRVTTVLSDTVVDGRTHWLLRDSASITRSDVWPEHSDTHDADIEHTREATGVRRGRWLYDPDQRLVRVRYDTLVLNAAVTRSLPDRDVHARQRLTVVEQWTALAPAEYARRQNARMEENRRTSGGMVIVLHTDFQKRKAAGDPALLDSLLTAWQIAADPETRFRTEAEISSWNGPRGLAARRLRGLAVAEGDTLTAFLQATASMRSYAETFDSATVAFMLPYLADAGRAFRNGIGLDDGYDPFFYALMLRPPVLATDSTNVCGPSACVMLERFRNRNDVDPRLRDLGIIAAFMRDPKRNFSLLESRQLDGTHLLQRVYRTALGYPNEWGSPGHGEPVPPPNSTWNAWATWAGGQVRELGGSPPVLQLFNARTGRDFVKEFRTAYEAASEDTARYTFGRLLLNVDPEAFTIDEVKGLLDSDKPALLALGRSALFRLTRNATVAPPEIAEPLLDELIGMLFEGKAPSWGNSNPRMRIDYHGRTGLFLITDSLPPALVPRWQNRISLITNVDWKARDLRAAGTGFHIKARQAGDFVILDYSYSEALETPADAVPRHFAGGGSIVLLRTPSGWKEVSRSAWVT